MVSQEKKLEKLAALFTEITSVDLDSMEGTVTQKSLCKTICVELSKVYFLQQYSKLLVSNVKQEVPEDEDEEDPDTSIASQITVPVSKLEESGEKQIECLDDVFTNSTQMDNMKNLISNVYWKRLSEKQKEGAETCSVPLIKELLLNQVDKVVKAQFQESELQGWKVIISKMKANEELSLSTLLRDMRKQFEPTIGDVQAARDAIAKSSISDGESLSTFVERIDSAVKQLNTILNSLKYNQWKVQEDRLLEAVLNLKDGSTQTFIMKKLIPDICGETGATPAGIRWEWVLDAMQKYDTTHLSTKIQSGLGRMTSRKKGGKKNNEK